MACGRCPRSMHVVGGAWARNNPIATDSPMSLGRYAVGLRAVCVTSYMDNRIDRKRARPLVAKAQ